MHMCLQKNSNRLAQAFEKLISHKETQEKLSAKQTDSYKVLLIPIVYEIGIE